MTTYPTNPAARLVPTALALSLLAACTTVPDGPSVMVLPGTGKSFDQFRGDDAECRQFASSQLGSGTASSNAVDSGVRSATLGTILGAAAGAAIDGSHGAGVGAGAGLALGGLTGTGAAQQSAGMTQRRYDMGYQQCMYAKGHRVPVYGTYDAFMMSPRGYSYSAPPSMMQMPPPPDQPAPPR